MTRQSPAVADAKRDASANNLHVRFCTVQMRLTGKRGVLHASALGMQTHFENYAIVRGVGSHIVSMVANYMMIASPSLPEAANNNLQLFYTQVWSSVDYHFTKSRLLQRAPYIEDVERFFHANPLPDAYVERLKKPVPVMVRQQDCLAMSTAAVAHLQTFPMRLHRYVVASLVSMRVELNLDNPSERDAARLAKKATDAIMLPNNDTKLHTFDEYIDKQIADLAYRKAIREFVEHERSSLLPLLDNTASVNLRTALNSGKYAHELIPHMLRISDAGMDMMKKFNLDGHLPPENEADANNADDDIDLHCDADDEDEDDHEDVHEDDAIVGLSEVVWKRHTKPRAFTVLPISKLRPAMAYYGPTEMLNMYSTLQSRKRKSRDADATLPSYDKATFGTELFDFKKVKGKRHAANPSAEHCKWRLSNFRTNGVVVSLTFVSGDPNTVEATNVSKLLERGYNIPVPVAPVTRDTRRGLYRVNRHGRNDLAHYQPGEHDSIAVVDPGFCKPIQVGEMSTSLLHQASTAVDTACQISFWHVTKDEWMHESGRDHQARREDERRRKNTKYRDALELLSSTRRRCSKAELFGDYTKAAMQTLADRADELTDSRRIHFRWGCTKRLEKFLSRVADKLSNRSSMRMQRQPGTRNSLSDDEKTKLRNQLQEKRQLRRENDPRRTVFFGDGTFRCTMRGNPSIPKKKLLKRLAVRTVTVLLDEYRTSSMCPCGIRLKNAPDDADKRVRVHKTDGGVCDLLKQVNDRDELATVNMLMAARSTLLEHERWPVHLCRDCD